MRLRWIQRSLAVATIAAGIAAGWWVHMVRGVELSPAGLRGFVAELSWAGPLLMVAIMALRPFLLMPSWIVLAVSGMLFGMVAGTIYGALGGAIGALIIFWIARVLGRDAVQSQLGGALAAFDRYLSQRGAPWLGAYTAVPVSVLTPMFFAAGVSSMRLVPYASATAVGFVPRAGMYAFLGQTVAEPSTQNLLLLSLIVIVAIAVVVLARRYLMPARSAKSGAGLE